MTPDTNSGGIDMASDNGVIGVPVTRVSRAIGRSVTVRGVAVTGPITRAISRGVAVTGPITRAISRGVAVTGPITIAISGIAVAVTVG
jgi:hypothetical protein